MKLKKNNQISPKRVLFMYLHAVLWIQTMQPARSRSGDFNMADVFAFAVGFGKCRQTGQQKIIIKFAPRILVPRNERDSWATKSVFSSRRLFFLLSAHQAIRFCMEVNERAPSFIDKIMYGLI